jgi:hypothetical protein
VDVSIDRMTFYADQLATAPHRTATLQIAAADHERAHHAAAVTAASEVAAR